MKRLISLFTILLFSSGVFAQDRYFMIDDFSKGMNSHVSEYSIKDNQSVLVQNLRVNDEYGNLSKRATRIRYADFGSNAITGLFRFYDTSADNKFTIVAEDTNLDYKTDSGSVTNLEGSFSSGERWNFTTYKDNLIGMNGSDSPIKWDGNVNTTADTDGARTAGALVAELGAPFAELNTGTDLDASSWYQYKIMYYDGTDTYYSTATSNPIQTGASVYNIYLTDIPLGPTGITARYIYRTVGQSAEADLATATYKLVDTISDNSTQVYADAIADASLTTVWSTAGKYNVTPPTGKYCEIHRQRLFIAGDSTYPSYLYWSDEYNPEYFSASDYEQIRPDDGDKITFIKNFLGILTIGKTNTIQKYYTDAAESSWYVSDPFSQIGCPAPYSVAVTPKGIFYYGRRGIYSFTGQTSVLISDAVTEQIKDINLVGIDDIVGYYYNNQYLFAYRASSTGASVNDRVLVYDLTRDAYVIDNIGVDSFAAFVYGDDFGILYSGESSTDGYVWAHGYSPSQLRIRFKSDLDDGTFDDTRSLGTETNAEFELAWDCTIDTWLTELQTKDANIDTIDEIETYIPTATIDRPDTDGTWTSPIYKISAKALDELKWNEGLNTYGTMTMQIKTCDDSACSGDSFGSTYTNPTGSDVSSETAEDWIQFIVNLGTSNINFSPTIYYDSGYLIKLIYSKVGSTEESDFVSKWDSGWKSFGSTAWKQLKRIRVFYTGEEGEVDIRYYNQDGNDNSFTINLATEPDNDSIDNLYHGSDIGDDKIYTHFVPINEDGTVPLGRNWRFTIENIDTDSFTIERIEVKYGLQPEVD